MAKTSAQARQVILDFLKDSATGLNTQLGGVETRDSVTLAVIPDDGWFTANLPAAFLDENLDASPYPCVLVYSGGSRNENVQKFRYFSGPHDVIVEIRVSVEGFPELASLEETLDRYVEAALNVLQSTAREWHGQAVLFNGEYSVSYSTVREGGLNFIQSARLALRVHQHASA